MMLNYLIIGEALLALCSLWWTNEQTTLPLRKMGYSHFMTMTICVIVSVFAILIWPLAVAAFLYALGEGIVQGVRNGRRPRN